MQVADDAVAPKQGLGEVQVVAVAVKAHLVIEVPRRIEGAAQDVLIVAEGVGAEGEGGQELRQGLGSLLYDGALLRHRLPVLRVAFLREPVDFQQVNGVNGVETGQ